jgi:hypothetical protein
MTIQSRIRAVMLVCVVAAGAFANRAALRGPLVLDDFAQRAMIEGKLTPGRGPFNLYDFVADDNRAALLDRGAIPWWSDPHLQIRFLRPLPSVLVWLDHRLFGYGAFVPHLFSMLWWLAAVLAAHTLYRAATGPRPALVATALFAFSPTLAIPVVWLANRDALITVTFGASALALYVRWRRYRARFDGLASAAAFCATALTGEYALSLGGYLVAFEIGQRGESFRRRLTGALPAIVPFASYALAHLALRYGSVGSGFYRDPISDPGGYLRALPRSLSTLLASAWLGVNETSPWLFSRPFILALILAAAALVIAPVLKMRGATHLNGDSSGGAWLACGSVLALLPLAATEPSRRILAVAALGVSGALGVLIDGGIRRVRPLRASAVADLAALLLIAYLHVVAALIETRRYSFEAVADETLSLARLSALRRPSHPLDTTLMLRANWSPTVLSTPFVLRDGSPRRWRVLSQTFEQIAAIRSSETSLDLAVENGSLFTLGPTDIFRTTPFRVGEVVEISGLRATVIRTDEEGRPKAVRYEFDQNLDGPEVAWMSEGSTGFGGVRPPPVGFGVRLAP